MIVNVTEQLRLFHTKTRDPSASKIFMDNNEVKEKILNQIIGQPFPDEKKIATDVESIYILNTPWVRDYPNGPYRVYPTGNRVIWAEVVFELWLLTQTTDPADEFDVFHEGSRGKPTPSLWRALFHLSCAYNLTNTPSSAPVVPAAVTSAPVAPAHNSIAVHSQPNAHVQVQAQVQQSTQQANLQEVNEQETDGDEVETRSEIDENSAVQDEQINMTTADSDEDGDSMPVNNIRKSTELKSKVGDGKRKIDLSPRKKAPKYLTSAEAINR